MKEQICIMSSFYEINKIPNYVMFWLESLLPHFKRIILVTNNRPINNLEFVKNLGIEVKLVNNEGYDFGMWYKVLSDFDINNIEQLTLVNDSTVLFANLTETIRLMLKRKEDVVGITDSIQYEHHLQSYFLMFKNSDVVKYVWGLFEANKILEGDIEFIIKNYEIRLSSYIKEGGFSIGAIYPHEKYNTENISVLSAKELINDGLPMIKKKTLLHKYREEDRSYLEMKGFDFEYDYIKDLRIKSYTMSENINIDYLIEI